jgi:hypothetical protein
MFSIKSNNTAQLNNSVVNPELRDNVYTSHDIERLRYIARLCPFTDGSAVYTARVILHAFEPDSAYYNYCEFVKRPDRESSDRNENMQMRSENIGNKNENFQLYPNPNNGKFNLVTSTNNEFYVLVCDVFGSSVIQMTTKATNGHLSIDMTQYSKGVYNIIIIDDNCIHNIRFTISN